MKPTDDLFADIPPAGLHSAFDAVESERRKHDGMAVAASARLAMLHKAREIARDLARRHGTVHMDMVNMELERRGIDPCRLGPGAGSLFKSLEWEFTGEFVKSARMTNHSRLLRVWRLRT